jgi:hypothetical protein
MCTMCASSRHQGNTDFTIVSRQMTRDFDAIADSITRYRTTRHARNTKATPGIDQPLFSAFVVCRGGSSGETLAIRLPLKKKKKKLIFMNNNYFKISCIVFIVYYYKSKY